MSILKTISLLFTLAFAFIMVNASTAYTQFGGSITVSGYKSTNVEGRDSATPDNVFNPSIDLMYNWGISNPAAIKFEATLTPTWYQEVKSRSYLKSFFGATGSFYLSDVTDNPKSVVLSEAPTPTLPPKTKTNTPPPGDTAKPTIIIKHAPADVAQIASVKLAVVSELLDSFEIDKKGLSADSVDIASDLKDSVSEAVLALSDILANQIFTESLADVVANEITNQRKIFIQVPMNTAHKTEIGNRLNEVIELIKGGNPQSDILPVPKPNVTVETPSPISEVSPPAKTNELLAQALQHLQSEDEVIAISGGNAPAITLINSQTEFKDFSSQDILLKDELTPLTKKTLATLLSVPVSLETQNNQGAYIIYSYSQFEFKPRLDLYLNRNFGLGTTYDLTITKFPHDSVHINDGTENKLRMDTRIEATTAFIITIDGGLSSKNYDDPIKYYIPVKGKQDRLVSTSANYSHFFLGSGLFFFPADRLTLSLAAALTRSATLRPYLIDSTLKALTGRSKIGGTQNDDEYSYELTRATIISIWRIFWDIKFSLDLSYENRLYANQQIARAATLKNPRPTPVAVKRDDYGPQFGLDLSREFFFDSLLISIFDSFTPVFDIQSSNYTSTVKLFSYKDITATLSFEFGF